MPTITIRDSLDAEIVSANPQLTTGFGRYLQGTSAALLAGVDVASQFRTPLHLVQSAESGFGLSWASAVPLANGAGALSLAGGSRAVVGVYNRRGMALLENTFIGEPLKVESGQGFVAFSIRPSLELGMKRQVGRFLRLGRGRNGISAFDLTGADRRRRRAGMNFVIRVAG